MVLVLGLARWNVRSFVRPSVRFSGQILLPRCLMNGLNDFDKTYVEYSLAPTNHWIRFWMSKVKVTAGRRGGEDIHVTHIDAGTSTSMF